MLKKCMALLLALALISPALPALAEDAPASALYRLVSRDAWGEDTLIGSAVLFMERDTLLTTVWAAQAKGALYAIGSGGEFAVSRGVKPTADSSLVVLTLAQQSPAAPLLLGSSETDALVSLGIRGDGAAVTSQARSISTVEADGAVYLIMSAEEGLLPGSILTDGQGNLAGIVTAAYGEGAGRYVVLPAESIYQQLTGESQEITYDSSDALQAGESWISDADISYADGVLSVDWTDSLPEGVTDEGCFTVFFADEQNPYYSYVEVTGAETSVMFPAVPGRNYHVWLLYSPQESDISIDLPLQVSMAAQTGEVQPFERYDYADKVIYVAKCALDTQAAADELLAPLYPITAEGLMDGGVGIYLQAMSCYAVDTAQEALLLAVLYTPEGYAFAADGGFIFDPSLMDDDVWHMEISELFDDYCSFNNSGQLNAGDYTLAYFLDGALANQLTFTLE